MHNQSRQVAIAILHQQHRFLLQLRDDIPGILYPGHWGLFGGHLEPGETPEIALLRELLEEINYTPSAISKFGCYKDPKVIRHVFCAPLTVGLNQLTLKEGWDMRLLTPEQIYQGSAYSIKANQTKPIAPPTHKILLDFINNRSFI